MQIEQFFIYYHRDDDDDDDDDDDSQLWNSKKSLALTMQNCIQLIAPGFYYRLIIYSVIRTSTECLLPI